MLPSNYSGESGMSLNRSLALGFGLMVCSGLAIWQVTADDKLVDDQPEKKSLPALRIVSAESTVTDDANQVNAASDAGEPSQTSQESSDRTERAESLPEPTHKQSKTIQPMHDGAPIALNTFCLDKEGNILACVGGDTMAYEMDGDTHKVVKKEAPKLVQVYSPDGDLLKEYPVPFKPTAINIAPNGTLFVAGEGMVAKLESNGEVRHVVRSPHVDQDMDALRERIVEAAKVEAEQFTNSFQQQIEAIEKRIERLTQNPEQELNERDQRRLAAWTQQKEMFESQLEMMKEQASQMFDPDQMLQRKLGITALAATSIDLFLSCNALEGHGYEVWRMNHDFTDAKRVVDGLGGCCGQFDLQATDDVLVLAENTRFQVGILDRDGARLSSFGQSSRGGSPAGFGSCCNPMNVRCCGNGDILTAESSIGTIKRFSPEGQLVGVVGKAKIGGGCKHVAMGYDDQLDRYYMMHQDKSSICVLVPKEQAPEFTEDEKMAKEAREGLGMQLIGQWSIDGKVAQDTNSAPQVPGLAAQEASLGEEEGQEVEQSVEIQVPSYFNFEADGKLSTVGSMFFQGESQWQAVKQQDNVLTIAQVQDGVENFGFQIEFTNEDEATISLVYGENSMGSRTFYRVRNEN
jgi:hypothetical protein